MRGRHGRAKTHELAIDVLGGSQWSAEMMPSRCSRVASRSILRASGVVSTSSSSAGQPNFLTIPRRGGCWKCARNLVRAIGRIAVELLHRGALGLLVEKHVAKRFNSDVVLIAAVLETVIGTTLTVEGLHIMVCRAQTRCVQMFIVVVLIVRASVPKPVTGICKPEKFQCLDPFLDLNFEDVRMQPFSDVSQECDVLPRVWKLERRQFGPVAKWQWHQVSRSLGMCWVHVDGIGERKTKTKTQTMVDGG